MKGRGEQRLCLCDLFFPLCAGRDFERRSLCNFIECPCAGRADYLKGEAFQLFLSCADSGTGDTSSWPPGLQANRVPRAGPHWPDGINHSSLLQSKMIVKISDIGADCDASAETCEKVPAGHFSAFGRDRNAHLYQGLLFPFSFRSQILPENNESEDTNPGPKGFRSYGSCGKWV